MATGSTVEAVEAQVDQPFDVVSPSMALEAEAPSWKFTEKLQEDIATLNDRLRQKMTENGFTEEEIELLERKWAHFLRQDVEVILFNEDFFAAAVPELKELADALHIKVRR